MVFTLQEAQEQFGKLIDLAQSGEEVTITLRGKTVAKLVPAEEKPAEQEGRDLVERRLGQDSD